MPRGEPCPREQGDHPLEVACRIDALGHLAAQPVELAGRRFPAVGIGGEDDTSNPVGREEAVLDPLAERVPVDGVAEVLVAVHVVAARGCGQTKLDGTGEVIENCPPGRVLLGAATMALVHDDQVEEVGSEGGEQRLLVAAGRECLVGGEVDLSAGVDAAAHPAEQVGAEGGDEVLAHRLGQQLVAVGEIEHAVVALRPHGGLVGS